MYQDYNNNNNMYNQYYGFPDIPTAYRHYQNPQTSEEIITFNQAIDLIRKSIASEREDALFYNDILKLAPTEKEKNILTSIRDDEKKHNQLFRTLYYKFTGQMIPQEDFNMINTTISNSSTSSSNQNNNNNSTTNSNLTVYRENLEKALFGELNAIIKYRKIMGAMPDEESSIILMSIMTDELRHANLYNFLINKAH